MAPTDAKALHAAVSRLTGVTPRYGREVDIFRVTVESSDGKTCSVNARVSLKKFYKANLHQMADVFRVPRDEIGDVLDNWTPERLSAHLSQFPAEVLDSREDQRLFMQHNNANPPAAVGPDTQA